MNEFARLEVQLTGWRCGRQGLDVRILHAPTNGLKLVEQFDEQHAKHVDYAEEDLQEPLCFRIAESTVQISGANVADVLPEIPGREIRGKLTQIGGLAGIDFFPG